MLIILPLQKFNVDSEYTEKIRSYMMLMNHMVTKTKLQQSQIKTYILSGTIYRKVHILLIFCKYPIWLFLFCPFYLIVCPYKSIMKIFYLCLRSHDVKRKSACIGGLELVSLSCNIISIFADFLWWGRCKTMKWQQFHGTDKWEVFVRRLINIKYTFR